MAKPTMDMDYAPAYRIMSASDPVDLETMVSHAIQSGYEACGGVSVITYEGNVDGSVEIVQMYKYCQAVCKKTE